MKKVKTVGYREVENIKIKGKPGEPEREVFARASLSPIMKAAVAIDKYRNMNGDYELSDLIVVLDKQVSNTLDGAKLEEGQRMLTGQAHTLDAIFNHLCIEAIENLRGCHSTMEMTLKMALKAQSQCRSTWLALSEIRNPRLANFVNQANIAGGHQQVNNHLGNEIPPNEVLEEECERVDFGTAEATSREHSKVETVGAVNRPNKRGREKQIVE